MKQRLQRSKTGTNAVDVRRLVKALSTQRQRLRPITSSIYLRGAGFPAPPSQFTCVWWTLSRGTGAGSLGTLRRRRAGNTRLQPNRCSFVST